MLEKRAFLLGFMLGKLAAENVPYEFWHSNLYTFCAKLNMTKPTREEMIEVGKFMVFISELYDRRNPFDA